MHRDQEFHVHGLLLRAPLVYAAGVVLAALNANIVRACFIVTVGSFLRFAPSRKTGPE